MRALEMLPRDYDATRRFYTEVLPFHEEGASGGEGERRCVLTAGSVRLSLREQPGKPAAPQRPAWLGVYPAPLNDMAAQDAGLKEPKGVLVEDLVPQGPAGAAGLLRGDIILAVEGKETSSPQDLIGIVRTFPPGKKVLVTLWRDRKKRDLPVDLPACPFPDQLAPIAMRLEVHGLDAFYREVLRRGIRVYAEPRDTADGGRVLELIDTNDILVVLEEPRSSPAAPAPPASPAAEPEPGKKPASGEAR